MFFYIAPLDEKDKRVWVGFFSTVPGAQAVHNHSLPVASKLGSGLKADIAESVKQNPNLKAGEIGRGIGVGYNPTSRTVAAANKGTLANQVKKCKVGLSGAGARQTITLFHDTIKRKVDELEANNGQTTAFNEEMLNLTTPYIRLALFFNLKKL